MFFPAISYITARTYQLYQRTEALEASQRFTELANLELINESRNMLNSQKEEHLSIIIASVNEVIAREFNTNVQAKIEELFQKSFKEHHKVKDKPPEEKKIYPKVRKWVKNLVKKEFQKRSTQFETNANRFNSESYDRYDSRFNFESGDRFSENYYYNNNKSMASKKQLEKASKIFYKNHTNLDPNCIRYTCFKCNAPGHYDRDCDYVHLLAEGSNNLNNEESGEKRHIKLNIDAVPVYFNSSKDPIQKDLKTMVEEEVKTYVEEEIKTVPNIEQRIEKKKVQFNISIRDEEEEASIHVNELKRMEGPYDLFKKFMDAKNIDQQLTRNKNERPDKSLSSSLGEEIEESYNSSGSRSNSKYEGTDESEVDNPDDTH